jgi:N-acetyl-anhydromuramyl-L-alanine amidase AmpD
MITSQEEPLRAKVNQWIDDNLIHKDRPPDWRSFVTLMGYVPEAAKRWPAAGEKLARIELLNRLQQAGYHFSSIDYEKLVKGTVPANQVRQPLKSLSSRAKGAKVPQATSEVQLDGESIPFYQSPNRSKGTDGKPPVYIVLHSTGGSFTSGFNTLRDPKGPKRVSAHFLVGRDGRIVQLVSLDDRSWHAGTSEYQGHRNLNRISIGIEMEHVDGKDDWSEAQIKAMAKLVTDLRHRFGIPVEKVIGHVDVAMPRKRKVDPMDFPWERFRTMIGQSESLKPSAWLRVSTASFKSGMRVLLPDGGIGTVESTDNNTLMVRIPGKGVIPLSPLSVRPY